MICGDTNYFYGGQTFILGVYCCPLALDGYGPGDEKEPFGIFADGPKEVI